MSRTFYLIILLFFSVNSVVSQSHLFDFLEEDSKDYDVFATFKGVKIVNLQSVEMTAKNEMLFVMSHRFATINSGIDDLFGLDYGRIRMSLDYGITDNINISLGRSSYDKVIDLSSKFKFINQRNNSMPVSIGYYMSISLNPSIQLDNFSHKLSYIHQLMLARKFNSNFSFQLSPLFIHYNLRELEFDSNDVIAIGIGSRYKINKSVSINLEYIPLLTKTINSNSFSLGFDIETGGHVFQLLFSNSTAMYEAGFVSQNYEKWIDGGVHFGFNITRVFNF